MECEEIRVDLRTIPHSADRQRSAQLLFRLNHTLPFSEEYNALLRELLGKNLGEGSTIAPPLSSAALDMLRVTYPDFQIVLNERTPEQAMRAALSDELRDALDACKINNSQENYQRLTATLAAAPLYFPAQRPDGAAAEADGQQHLQFGKVRTNDGRTFFCAFTDRARLVRWRNMGSVELGVKDYTSLVLSSNDTGIIIDPGVGSGLALTREMLQTLQAQTEFIDQMRAAATELGLDFDADAISEAARNINVDEPEKTGRKERRWFGKKKK